MVAIIDYGVGNLFSLECSLRAIGEEAVVASETKALEGADGIILPGVGAFGDAIEKLRKSGLDRTVISLGESGKPILGICLGMQLLFERSFEYGEHEGLGLIKGSVKNLSEIIPAGCKIPHMGWNSLSLTGKKHPILKNTRDGDFVYFVHSFAAVDCEESTLATTDYGAPVTAAVANGNISGCQFHPEKSGEAGLAILRAFCEEGRIC